MRRSLILTCAPVAAVVALAATVPPAHAAFPGRNGVIAFDQLIGFDDQMPIVGLSPRHRFSTLIPQSRRRGAALTPQFSPGGRLLAFEYIAEHLEPDIWLKSVSRRSRPRRMIGKPPGTDFHGSASPTSLSDEDPDWSPDGKRIVFSRAQYTDSGGEVRPSEIRIYHRGHSQLLISDGDDPTWSVRNEIAFVRREGRSDATIYSIRPDGTGLRRITTGREPDWSPDGRRLAFTTSSFESARQVRTISRKGRGLRRITGDGRCDNASPVFSPGGGQLAFVRGVIDVWDCPEDREGLAAVRTDGRHLRMLTHDAEGNTSIDWQPLPRRRR